MEYCYPFVKQKLSHEEKTLREVNYYINVLRRAQPAGDFLYIYVCIYNLVRYNYNMHCLAVQRHPFTYRISGIFGEHYIWRMKVKVGLAKD